MKIVELEFQDWKHSVRFKRTIDAEQKRVITLVTTGEVVKVSLLPVSFATILNVVLDLICFAVWL